MIPYFIGFHPASEGGTTYDYLKLNKKNLVMNIGVKKNFTKNKKNEPGVVGSYYFNEINHLKKVLEEIRFDKKEIYLSHLIILMIKNKINVYPYKVNKFLCLGTPKDYYQYKNFDNYFHRKKQKNIFLDQVLIPMAGSGSRMKKDKFKTMKPYITVEKSPCIM